MALCCIGGVCIPYSAIVPFVLLGLKWFLTKLAMAGLLPASIEKLLDHFLPSPVNQQQLIHHRRSKISKEPVSTACCGTAINNWCNSSVGSSNHTTVTNKDHKVLSSTEEEVLTLLATNAQMIVLKFTSSSCQPCQHIQPVFEQMALDYAHQAQFVVVDINECEQLSARFNILLLPTFVAVFQNTIVQQYSGSDQTNLQEFVHNAISKTK